MARQCPNCGIKLRPIFFLMPKFWHQYRCPACKAKIGFTGIFFWGLEIVALLIGFAIYRLVDGKVAEASIALLVAVIFVALEIRFARIR